MDEEEEKESANLALLQSLEVPQDWFCSYVAMPWGLNVEDALLRKMLWCVSVSREDQLMTVDVRHD